MQEVVHAFGIDWRLIVIQIFNFTLLMAVLWYFLYTPILNILKERQQKIAQGVKDAEDAKLALEQTDSERSKILNEANTEAEGVVARAKQQADEQKAEIIKNADTRATAIVNEAESRSEALRKQALKESEAELAKVAVLAAEKIMKQH